MDDRRKIETPGFEGQGPAGLQVRPAQPVQQPQYGYQQPGISDGGAQYPPAAAAVPPQQQLQPPPPQQPVKDPNLITLSRDYDAYGDRFRSILFRLPNAGDLRKCGYPLKVTYDDAGKVTHSEPVPDSIAKYVVAIGTAQKLDGGTTPIPEASVNSLSLEDFDRCTSAVLRFFL